ncbi:MAG: PorV/PorQ family protein [Candidatus Marinimicrobia bacterium]|nr:PorV/PorQ family protein [bacterium]MCG2714981.1 PorV/PorQ family protein [Candidatus Neomarinimicrobiota bacterium]
MKKQNIFLQILIITCLFFTSMLYGQENFKKVSQSGMQYLKIGVDAAMVGRGEAGISAIKGVSAIFWNPAGLSYLNGKEIFSTYNAWIADISLNAIAAGISFGKWGTLGLSVLWMDYGELYGTSVPTTVLESTELGYVDEGTFSPADIAIGLAYSRQISSQFAVGGHVRYLYENYGDNVIITTNGIEKNVDNIIHAFSFDLGTLYYPGFKSLAFSMSIQNFSPDIKFQQEAFSPPLTFKLGLSMDLLDFARESSHNTLLFAVDAIHPRDYSERLNIGIEYNYLGMFQLRGGYRMNYDEGTFTTGGGFLFPLNNSMQLRINISYIFITSDRFSSPMQVTVGLEF